MKRFLSTLLSLILCLGIFVSCNDETPTESSSQSEGVKESGSEESSRNHEETMTTLDSENESVDISSESNEENTETLSEIEDGVIDSFFEKVVLDGITAQHFEAYTAHLDEYYYPIGFEGNTIGFIAKAIFTYEEFVKGAVDNVNIEAITEQTFEDNFVIIVQGVYPVLRTFDMHYTNFTQEDNFYSITFNAVYSRNQGFNEMHDRFVDICVIPKSLCNNTTLTEVKLIYKIYVFEDQIYNSSCEVTTYLPE